MNPSSAAPSAKGVAEDTNAGSRSRNRQRIVLTIKSAALLAEIAALGYVTLDVVEQERPLLEASAGYALESAMVKEAATTEGRDLPPATESAAVDRAR